MADYSELKTLLKFDADKKLTDEHAYITHYLQNTKNGVSKAYKEKALSFIKERLETGNELDEQFQTSKTSWDVPFPPPEEPKFKFIDLFAGIGGFRIALQDLKGKCVFSSEFDNAAKKTYETNFGEFPFGDIRQFTGDHVNDDDLNRLIPNHNVLVAGFPCQPFSLAGVSARNHLGQLHGFNDEDKGNLFYDIMRIIQVKKPDVVFLENVKNFERHDDGHTYETVKMIMEDWLNYQFFSTVINAKQVVPQKRERIYMVCFRKPTDKFSFPEFLGEPKKLKSILEENVPEKYTISDKLWEGHINRTARNIKRGTGFTAYPANLEKPANTLVARYGKDGKECLIPQEDKNPRKLTPRECARLQGFPEKFILPSSDARAYRQFGNSVAVPVIKAIMKKIVRVLEHQGKLT
jgi:DNA (cytosine-5)-methyltransferase 1